MDGHKNASASSDYRNFSYTYDKGRRSSENVLGRSYSYDRDGNVTNDGVNPLQIGWNLLDLPLSVSDFDGYEQRYTYLADGTKVGRSYRGTEYAYSGSLTYKDGWLESVPFGGGRIEVDSAGLASPHYFLTDHLGSARVIALVNGGGRWIQERSDYYPFGEAWKTNGMPSEGNRYTFSGKEESGLWLDDEGETKAAIQDFGARYYDSEGVMWLSQDPNAEKYYPISPYADCSGNPVRFIDPDGRDAIYIAFPKYRANGIPFTGHAGVLLIDNKTGLTKYYEYGRYDKEGKGLVRTVSVSHVVIGKDGKPTTESLNKVMKQLSDKSGHGGDIEGAYIISDKFKEMNDYAKGKMSENSDPERKKYSITSNNCATFAEDVITQDKSVDKPSSIINSPVNIVNEYQEEGNARVQYKVKTKTTTIGTGNEKDAKVKKRIDNEN
jgi:RHS repeat-associated protein